MNLREWRSNTYLNISEGVARASGAIKARSRAQSKAGEKTDCGTSAQGAQSSSDRSGCLPGKTGVINFSR